MAKKLEELKDKRYGKKGTPKRDAFEIVLKKEKESMEKFTLMEKMVVVNALKEYADNSKDEKTASACFKAREKLMPILLSKTREEFNKGVSELLKTLDI